MVETIENWNGQDIQVCQSKGGTTAICDYHDNLIIPDNVLFPLQDIVKKLYKSNHLRHFPESDHKALQETLGFYCDLQSVNSEDAITWSVFGTLNYYPLETRNQFINSLLAYLEYPIQVSETHIQLWTRIAHPDTLVSGGPELDFHIITDKIVIFGEAKWGSFIDKLQGKNRDKDQLQLRREYFEKYGSNIYPDIDEKIVLFVGNEIENTNYPGITWVEISENTIHPMKEEIIRYIYWKNSFHSA